MSAAETSGRQLPRHIAIIMDGNGRWAKQRGLPRTAGHQEGVKRTREIIEECGRLGVEILTLYVFSTENWRRPPEEVSFLMGLLEDSLMDEVERMHQRGARVRFLGLREGLSPQLAAKMRAAEEKTAGNTGLNVNLAINYGGRVELVEALRRAVEEHGEDLKAGFDESLLEKYLFTAGQPDPDLVIRTSGEQRISNFLLWQIAYAELYFTPVLWPDFDRTELAKAIAEYQRRRRRFGGVESVASERAESKENI